MQFEGKRKTRKQRRVCCPHHQQIAYKYSMCAWQIDPWLALVWNGEK